MLCSTQSMNKTVLDFLGKERVCVLSGILPDGGSHSSTLHYSYQSEPLQFFFQTWDESTKVQALLKGQNKQASLVIGFSEQDNLTFQARCEMRIVIDPVEREAFSKIHYQKHPFAEQFKDEHTRLIVFTPTWWRYTDFTSVPEKIIVI